MSNNNQGSKIAKNLKKIRQDKGISQDRLSKLADLSLNTVVTVESGANPNPTIETLTRIAKALDVGVDDLIKN
ncbi:MAG: helix-turn-helix transcriptional regulator [Patescibacteria group bacterium]